MALSGVGNIWARRIPVGCLVSGKNPSPTALCQGTAFSRAEKSRAKRFLGSVASTVPLRALRRDRPPFARSQNGTSATVPSCPSPFHFPCSLTRKNLRWNEGKFCLSTATELSISGPGREAPRLFDILATVSRSLLFDHATVRPRPAAITAYGCGYRLMRATRCLF